MTDSPSTHATNLDIEYIKFLKNRNKRVVMSDTIDLLKREIASLKWRIENQNDVIQNKTDIIKKLRKVISESEKDS